MTVLSVPTLDERPWPTLGPQVFDWMLDNLIYGPGDLRGERLSELPPDDEFRGLLYRAYEVFPRDHPRAGRRRFRRVAWSLRKGTAKTERAAWIAAAELHPDAPVRCDGWTRTGSRWDPVGVAVTDPYLPMVGVTEDATEDLAYAALYTILAEGPLADDFDIGLERIVRKDGSGKAQPLASAPDARDGARTTWQHFDESHRLVLPRLLERNPASADLIDRPKVVYTGEFDTYTGEEVELLAAHASVHQDAAIYRVAAYTGLRQGELLALRWSDVDFVGGLLHVRRNYTDRREKSPKGKRVRSVPMTPAVVDTLGRLKERGHLTDDGDLVFCNTAGDHVDSWALRRRFYAAIEEAGLRRIRFHDLRHAFGTAAIAVLDAYRVQSYMGHQHYSTTQRYLHHKPRPQDAQALHEAFGGDVSPTVSRTEAIPDELSATSDA